MNPALTTDLLSIALAPSLADLGDRYATACVRFCDDESALVAILRAAILRCERFGDEVSA